MRKMKNINGYLVVRFNDREKREHEGTALGNFGVIDAELYTGILDIDRGAMEYDDAETIEEAVELARGLEPERDAVDDEDKVKVEVIVEIDGQEHNPAKLFAAEKGALERQINSDRYPDIDERTAAHELHGFALALRQLGIIKEDAEEFHVGADVFDGVAKLPPTRSADGPRAGWRHLDDDEHFLPPKLYALGQALAENCPQNDCVVYRNIFQQARELDEALDGLDGYAAEIIRRELRARVRELGRMYRTNYAVSNYRKGARA